MVIERRIPAILTSARWFAAEPAIRPSRRQLLLANNAAVSVELPMTTAAGEGAAQIICFRFKFGVAVSIAAVMTTIVCCLKMIYLC